MLTGIGGGAPGVAWGALLDSVQAAINVSRESTVATLARELIAFMILFQILGRADLRTKEGLPRTAFKRWDSRNERGEKGN
jgi:hypothetical protein